MFKLKIDLEKGYIQAVGSVIDVSADVLFAISEIYAAFKRSDKRAAEAFQRAMIIGVNSPDSPCFNGEGTPGMSFIFSMGKKDGAE